jgi:hypothetical protein
MSGEHFSLGRRTPEARRPRASYGHRETQLKLGAPDRRMAGFAPPVLCMALALIAGWLVLPVAGFAMEDTVLRHRVDPKLEPRRHVPSPTFRTGHAPFFVQADGRRLLFSVQAIPALPGQTIEFRPSPGETADDFTLRLREGAVVDRDGGWSWTAPPLPGAYPLEVVHHPTQKSVSVTVLVAHPAERVESGLLHGFRLGRYLQTAFRGNPAYLPPEGFIEVPSEYLDLAVSPHFALGQFLCKQDGERRFLLLTPDLVIKLEAGLEAMNRAGYSIPTFHIMSGFRTPAYNRAIGNTSVYSRHLYGDAADIFVDVDGDGYMDDLNEDGRRDMADARVLRGFFEGLAGEYEGEVKAGGLGSYGPKPHRGPFIHVDTRGNRARW